MPSYVTTNKSYAFSDANGVSHCYSCSGQMSIKILKTFSGEILTAIFFLKKGNHANFFQR